LSVYHDTQAGSMLFAPAIVHRLLRRELDLSTWIMMGYSLRYVSASHCGAAVPR
jgi:hypothetical protein